MDGRFTAKDLIVTGVFTALLFICAGVGGGIFAITPTLTFYYPIGASLLAGPVFMLYLAKVPKRGALIISGIIMCAVGTLTGMHWGMNFGYLVFCTIASFVAGTGQFKNKVLNIIAYILYSIGPMGTYFVFFFMRDSWVKFMLKKGTEQEYIDKMNSVAGPGVMIIMVVGTIVVATLSGLLGLRLMEKQFEKAGIAE